MATPLPCDNHHDELAAALITNLETGDTLTLCGPCLIAWAEIVAGVGDMARAAAEEETQPATEVEQAGADDLGPDLPPKSALPEEAPTPRPPRRRPAPAQETETPGE